MNDLVSVIIPTYKRAIFIERAIESVLNQTYRNIEIIIVDDNGLESESQKITEEALNKYILGKKVRYITNKVNVGGAKSRNNGVEHSSGQFISFLDDDDTYDEKKIMEQMKVLKSNHSIDVCYCGMTYLEINGNKVGKRNIYLEGSSHLLSRHIYRPITGTPALLMKRSVFDHVNGFDLLNRYQDANLIFKLLANDFKFKSVKKELVNVYQHSGERITNSDTRFNTEHEYIENCLQYLDKISYSSSKLLLDKYHMLKIFLTKKYHYAIFVDVIRTLKLRIFYWKNLLGFANYLIISLQNKDIHKEK